MPSMSARFAQSTRRGPLLIIFALAVALTAFALVRAMAASPAVTLPSVLELRAPVPESAAGLPQRGSEQQSPGSRSDAPTEAIAPGEPPSLSPEMRGEPEVQPPSSTGRVDPRPVAGVPAMEAHSPGVIDRSKRRVYELHAPPGAPSSESAGTRD
jgi:hypothetical protein